MSKALTLGGRHTLIHLLTTAALHDHCSPLLSRSVSTSANFAHTPGFVSLQHARPWLFHANISCQHSSPGGFLSMFISLWIFEQVL